MASTPSGGMSAEDQMRDEIARLTATINQHKFGQTSTSTSTSSGGYYTPQSSYGHGYYGGYRGRGRGRGGIVNVAGAGAGGGGPHKQYVRPGLVTASGKGKESISGNGDADGSSMIVDEKMSTNAVEEGNGKSAVGGKKEVTIGGVTFEASKRSLVRKDLATSTTKITKPVRSATSSYIRGHGHFPRRRTYKPKGRGGRNMTLDNTNRTYQSKKATIRKIDKPCPRFTKTGTCSRGLTCAYQHDANKIAICWNFMQGDCPNTGDTCNLSHNPTPERTPLCVHFLNRGRCNKENCLFPHVNVGKKEGVCRDFAVLGYCEKGVDCDKNHVRECPEFEETGECRTKGCKLPHVIKANARWVKRDPIEEKKTEDEKPAVTAENGKLGDEYISLIFNESDSENGSEDDDDDDDGEDEEGEEGEQSSEEESEGK